MLKTEKMSTNELEKSKNKSKLIMCKNCHQDILEEKMFLHEGFCIRNNVYCEKCEKVFLKKDYDEHIKNNHNNNNKSKKESSSQGKKSPEAKAESEKKNLTEESKDNSNNENKNIETINPTPSLEYVQMPVTELYSINNPIIISENGQIVSNKNQNEFLLPYLGINLFQNSKKSEEILDGIIKQGDIFKENNSFSRNPYKIEELQTIFYKKNSNPYNRANTNVFRNYRQMNSNNTYDERKTNYNYNNNYNKSKSFVNNINYTESNINDNSENTPINLTNNNGKNIKKNFIINNSIKPYYSNKNLKKTHRLFPNKENQQKPPLINDSNNNSIFRHTHDPFNNNSIMTYHPQTNNSYNNIFENNFTRNKEPKDNNSRKTNLIQSSGQKKNPNKPLKPNTANGKNNMTKRCEFCNYIFNIEEINSHYKYCKNKNDKNKIVRKFDIPKPKKTDKLMAIEHYNNVFNEEKGIEEKQKESMNRDFNTALNLVTFNNEKKITKGMVPNPGQNVKTIKLTKEQLKNSIKNNILYLNETKFEKDDIPEDTIKDEKTDAIRQTMSIDGNTSNDFFGKCTKIINSPASSSISMSNEEIDPWLYFYNNNKMYKGHLGPFKEENNKKIAINRYEYEE